MILAADDIDAVLVIYAPPVVTAPVDVARAVADAVGGRAGGTKPVAACFLARADVADVLRGDGVGRRTDPDLPVPRDGRPGARTGRRARRVARRVPPAWCRSSTASMPTRPA